MEWSLGAIILACFVAPNLLAAAEGTLSCVEEVAVPAASLLIAPAIPASVQVTLTVGADGRAEGMTDTAGPLLRIGLRQAFVENSRYSTQCKGQRLTFEVRYEVAGEATLHAESVTRFLPPNKFVVICHPVKGSLN